MQKKKVKSRDLIQSRKKCKQVNALKIFRFPNNYFIYIYQLSNGNCWVLNIYIYVSSNYLNHHFRQWLLKGGKPLWCAAEISESLHLV